MSGAPRIPLVLGRELGEGRYLLHEAGVDAIEIRLTSPPPVGRHSALAGPPRVVRQRVTAHGVELVVAGTVLLGLSDSAGSAGQ